MIRLLSLVLILFSTISTNVFSQGTHTARQLGSTNSSYGFYEYLPVDYNKNTNKYPLIIFLHGSGEKGNGTTQLVNVLKHGVPREINRGRDFPFVVISPQSEKWWNYAALNEFIEYLKVKYRVDASRIYMTGLSMGGASTYRFAAAFPDQLAAIVPVAGEAEGLNSCKISHIPTWAFHGDSDGTVSCNKDINTIKEYNACLPTPSPLAKITVYPGVGHNSWTRTYDGSAGHDIYSWFLKFTKPGSTPAGNVAPTVSAGGDKTINLPTTSLTLTGSAQDGDGTIQTKEWTKLSGPSVTISGQTTYNLKLSYLVEGTYTFRFKATDNDGASTYDDVKVTVNGVNTNEGPTVDAGDDKTITLPTNSLTLQGSATDADGTIQSVNWTQRSGPAATMSNESTYNLKLTNLVAGTYTFRLNVRDNDGASRYDDAVVVVNPEPNEPSNEAPIVNAGSDKSVTLPSSSLTLQGTAQDVDGTIQSKQWSKLNGPSCTLSGQTNFNLQISNLNEGTYNFRLTVKDDDGASRYDDVKVTVNPEPVENNTGGSGKSYLINFNKGYNAGSPWNNFNEDPDPQDAISNLIAEDGTSSAVKITLLTPWGWQSTGNSGSNTNGAETGNNSGIFPDLVMKTAFWTERNEGETVEISGLNPNATYSLTMFGSRKGGADRTTLYAVGGKSTSLYVSENTKNTATLADIKPNSSGVINLTVNKAAGSDYAYLNALKIVESGSTSDGGSSTTGSATSEASTYQINFNEGSNLASPWNNFNVDPDAGDKLTNIKDIEGASSTIGLELLTPWGWQSTGGSGSNNRGATTGDNSGAYPDVALRTAFWTERNEGEQIKVYGLDPAQKYSFTFIGSRDGGGDRTSIYSIGNTSVSLNASYNTQETVQIQGVQPNTAGEIIIMVNKGANSSFAYLNAMTIQTGTSANTESRIAQQETSFANIEEAEESLTAYPNPAINYIEVAYGGTFSPQVNVQLINSAGDVVLNENIVTNDAGLKIDFAGKSITQGLYILHITDGNKKFTSRIVKQ